MPPQEPPTTEKPAPAETPAADAAATPQPTMVSIPEEQWNNIQAKLAHLGGQVEGMAAAVGRTPPPAPPPERHWSDEELAEMLESGEGAKILKAQRIIQAQAMRPLVDDFVNFRSATISTAERLGRGNVVAQGLAPYYNDPDIKRQIDETMEKLAPEVRANEQTFIMIHDSVVGKKENIDRIVKKEVDAELRRRAGTPDAPDVGSAAGRVPASRGSSVPSVTELLGADAAQALKLQGRSADEFARRMGYKTWADYAKEIESQSPADDEVVQ